MRIILNDQLQSVDFNNITVQLYDFRNVTAVRVQVTSNQGQQVLRLLSDYFSSNFTMFGQRLVSVENRGVNLVVPRCELMSLSV